MHHHNECNFSQPLLHYQWEHHHQQQCKLAISNDSSSVHHPQCTIFNLSGGIINGPSWMHHVASRMMHWWCWYTLHITSSTPMPAGLGGVHRASWPITLYEAQHHTVTLREKGSRIASEWWARTGASRLLSHYFLRFIGAESLQTWDTMTYAHFVFPRPEICYRLRLNE